MSLTDQVSEMLHMEKNKLSDIKDDLKNFERLVSIGLIRRREYDLPPVNVFGSSKKPSFSATTANCTSDAVRQFK